MRRLQLTAGIEYNIKIFLCKEFRHTVINKHIRYRPDPAIGLQQSGGIGPALDKNSEQFIHLLNAA